MKIKIGYSKFIWLMSFVAFALHCGCTDNFEDLNTNKHAATEDMMSYDNLKTGAFFSQLQRNVVLFDDGVNLSSDYQVAQGLSSDLYSGYFSPTGSWYQGKHNGSYLFIDNWIKMTFEISYSRIMPAWESIAEVAEEYKLPEIAALATIIKVQGMHRVADAYGPIPYIGYGSGSLDNEYDALDKVYDKFFEELDEAIEVLTNFANGNPGVTLMGDYDYIYNGNVKKWVKFANTLRLRLAMRIVYASPIKAKEEAEKAVANSIGLMSDFTDVAEIQHSSNLTYFHPLYDIAYNFNSGEIRMGATMDSYMNGYADPRLAAYFNTAGDGQYHGVRLGINTSTWSDYIGDKISNLNIDKGSSTIVWMKASEAYFLRAEGALRGWNMGGSAKDFYEQGISVSFKENSIGDASDYINDNTNEPIAFEDNTGNYGGYTKTSDITIQWDDSDNQERNLERIITQKWIALYPDGPEGWAEFRRTGYPKLLPVVNNNSGGTIDTDVQVRRLPYPESEYSNNSEGVNIGVGHLGGSDNGGTKLWWDKK